MPIGIYIHIPFCRSKCPYCDFYSFASGEPQKEEYAKAVCRELEKWGRLDTRADTLYFGGGTPTLLGAERLCRIISKAREHFSLEGAEITVEANPSGDVSEQFYALKEGGVNRLSFGLQSAKDCELLSLGRRHTARDAEKAVNAAQKAGFDNISLDLMLGIEGQTTESLTYSIGFCKDLGASHVSAYILKIEEGTPFYDRRHALCLPDEDETSKLYLAACEELEKAGFSQYEISNFAKKGRESRHNLKYWNCEEYLGIGPSAHSFLQGRRFYTPRDFDGFLKEAQYIDDGPGGDEEEYIMLRLRLTEGVDSGDFRRRYGKDLPPRLIKKAKSLDGLVECDEKGIRITRQGFLVSNRVITEILSE